MNVGTPAQSPTPPLSSYDLSPTITKKLKHRLTSPIKRIQQEQNWQFPETLSYDNYLVAVHDRYAASEFNFEFAKAGQS